MPVTKLGFIFATTLLFLFITNVSALMAIEILDGFVVDATANFTGISILDLLIGVINNIGIFIALTTASSEFFLFGATVMVAYAMSMIYLLVEVLRGI